MNKKNNRKSKCTCGSWDPMCCCGQDEAVEKQLDSMGDYKI